MLKILLNKMILSFALIISTYSIIIAQDNDSLNHYLRIAAINNHGLKSEFAAFEASLQKVVQAGALSDPQLEMGIFLQPMETIDGNQIATFKLMQMFPWFGSRKAAKTEAQHMSKMAYEKFRETRDELFYSIYNQWFILCNLKQKLINTELNIKILTNLEELALRRFSNSNSLAPSRSVAPQSMQKSNSQEALTQGMGGMESSQVQQVSSSQQMNMSNRGSLGSSSSGMSDILRIQLELKQLESTERSIISEISAAMVKFNSYLSRSSNLKVEIPEKFEKMAFNYQNVDQILESISNNSPMLKMISEESLAFKARAEMNKRMSYPMLGIGVNYSMLSKRIDDGMGVPTTAMNGKDMIMPMVTITIPIYRKKYNAQISESNLYWKSSKERYSNKINELESQYYSLKHLLSDSDRKIDLYSKQINLAQTTYNVIIQEFITGKSDLTNVLQVQRQLLDYQIKVSEAISEYNTLVVSLKKLMSNFTND